jgi:hypothetical protein
MLDNESPSEDDIFTEHFYPVISTHFPYRLHSIEGLSLTRISYVLDKLYEFVYNCNDSTFVLIGGLPEWNEVPEHARD